MAIKYSLPEMMGLADRLIGRGTSQLSTDRPEAQKDTLMAGRILAHCLLNSIISEPIELENGSK